MKTTPVGFFFLLVCLMTLACFSIKAQSTIAVQDFEAAPATPTWAISSGAANISTANGAGDTPANQRIRGGTRSWQVNNGTATLNLASVSTAFYNTIRVTVRISATSTVNNNGVDAGDTLTVSAALNGGAFPATPDITVRGGSQSRWSFNNTVNDTTPAGTPISSAAGNGTNAAPVHSTLVITIPNGTNSVALRIIALNSAPQEVWSVDDVTITGSIVTAATANILGRVLNQSDRGISGASVSLYDTVTGETRVTRTNQFGYFRFLDIQIGDFYILGASRKGFLFDSPSLQLFEETNGVIIRGNSER